uniref:Cadherin domain-containing protein n=1 Tax=Periophthalmus magnuspinnatus TaxID=409849 RepID=A0A3B4B9I4_9GOBI
NYDYRREPYIARIRSDKENFTKILYSLEGPGVNLEPKNRFGINSETGDVKIFVILDREEIASYDLKGVATFMNGSRAEKDIPLVIKVLDENDCAPVVKLQTGSVKESSAAGTFVMKVIATDADEENTVYSQIAYSIVRSSSSSMFSINAQTGEIMVSRNTLDRETQDIYKLMIQVADLNGYPGGNVRTGEIEIKILDINDNIPTLEKEFYEGSVEENTVNVEVMRIQAIDLDLQYSENWMAVYEITDGNQAGYFTITTDPKTNEGVIMITKSVDYEELKVVNLEVSVRNKAAYAFGSSGGGGFVAKGYPIKINVVNQKEGPRFQPSVKVVTLSEDRTQVTLNSIISTYAAIDTDTGLTATNVRYAKIYDEDNWLIIDEKTADIRLNKLPDRESIHLINGTYYAKIICITNDSPAKTATGTIAIQVEDFNDNCPKLISTTQTMCLEDTSVYATAVDVDKFPNSAPFEFKIVESKTTGGKWTIEPLNETSVILRETSNLWPGTYRVALEIKDQQGKDCGEAEVMDVIVCACEKNVKTCRPRSTKTVEFGPSGILMLLLGLLLLLLLPLLLLFCLCGGASALGDFKALPFETKQQLISYHTEGQGEDKEVPLLIAPMEVDGGPGPVTKDINYLSGGAAMGGGGAAAGGGFGGGLHSTWTENMDHFNQYSYLNRHGHHGFSQGGTLTGHDHYLTQSRGAFDGMALSEGFLGEYYLNKASHESQQNQQKDAFLVYDYEGRASRAGSVGCCSLLEKDDDLSFLDDLGPKFKKLAEICQGSAIVTDTVDSGVSFPAPKPPAPPVIPSTHTHVHTHSETVRDRERDSVNVNSAHTNVNSTHVTSSGSSTLIRERHTERNQPNVHVQVPTQTLLIQQPAAMYYAATPMYVMESKPQMVLVAGGAQQAVAPVGQVAVGQMGQMGLTQGLVQVGGLQGSQGVVLGVASGAAAAAGQASAVRSQQQQVIVVEEGGVREQGAQSVIHSRHGSSGQGLEVIGQGSASFQRVVGGVSGSTGSMEDLELPAMPKAQGGQRVVVQHKKVLVTESRESRA